jgi:DNA-binding transcriptional LysR family regulator
MAEPDLNLLRVFDTLFELRSVTRTARRMNLTQSAVSHALGRLRGTMNDELFVRGPGGLEPTSRAIEIAPGIRDGLTRLRGALALPIFDPAAAHRRFVIASGTYMCAMLVPAITASARIDAPGISFQIVPIASDLITSLDRGLIDVALGVFPGIPARFVAEPLFEEELVWVVGATNPLARHRVDAATLARQPRVGIAAGRLPESGNAEANAGIVLRQVLPDSIAWLQDPSADTFVTVYNSETAIAIAARSDAVALVPRRSVAMLAGKDVTILDTEETLPPIMLTMLWHRKQREDEGLAWLRALLAAGAKA